MAGLVGLPGLQGIALLTRSNAVSTMVLPAGRDWDGKRQTFAALSRGTSPDTASIKRQHVSNGMGVGKAHAQQQVHGQSGSIQMYIQMYRREEVQSRSGGRQLKNKAVV